MSDTTETTMRCPVCGDEARVRVARGEGGGTPHVEVSHYECGNGCEVDGETVRRIIGAQ